MTTWYTGTAGATNTFTNVIVYSNATTSSTAITPVYDQRWVAPQPRLQCGGEYELPDGSKLKLDRLGNYQVLDADAKVIYRASRVREFNPYINASDLLEAFITEVGQLDGVDQGEVLRLPIETFINWLILQAAKRDGDSTANLPTVESALPALPAPKTRLLPRCECCGRFIRKTWERARIAFCSPEHMQLKLERLI